MQAQGENPTKPPPHRGVCVVDLIWKFHILDDWLGLSYISCLLWSFTIFIPMVCLYWQIRTSFLYSTSSFVVVQSNFFVGTGKPIFGNGSGFGKDWWWCEFQMYTADEFSMAEQSKHATFIDWSHVCYSTRVLGCSRCPSSICDWCEYGWPLVCQRTSVDSIASGNTQRHSRFCSYKPRNLMVLAMPSRRDLPVWWLCLWPQSRLTSSCSARQEGYILCNTFNMQYLL